MTAFAWIRYRRRLRAIRRYVGRHPLARHLALAPREPAP